MNLQRSTNESRSQDKALEICCANTEILHYSCSFFLRMRRIKFYEKCCKIVIKIVQICIQFYCFLISLPSAADGTEKNNKSLHRLSPALTIVLSEAFEEPASHRS